MQLLGQQDPYETALFHDLVSRIRRGPCGDVSFPDSGRNLRFLYFAARELPVVMHGSTQAGLSCLEPRYPSFRRDTDRAVLFASPSPILVLEIVAWKLTGRRRLFCYDYYGRWWGGNFSLRGVSIDAKFIERLRDAVVAIYLCPASSFELGRRRCWCDRLTLGVVRGLTEHVSETRVTPLASVRVKLGTLFDEAWRHRSIEPRPWVVLRYGLHGLRWTRDTWDLGLRGSSAALF